MNYKISADGHEDYSVWNVDTNRKVAEHIPFASCASNLIKQLNEGLIEEKNVSVFNPKED